MQLADDPVSIRSRRKATGERKRLAPIAMQRIVSIRSRRKATGEQEFFRDYSVQEAFQSAPAAKRRENINAEIVPAQTDVSIRSRRKATGELTSVY